jgi:hypothetical protein
MATYEVICIIPSTSYDTTNPFADAHRHIALLRLVGSELRMDFIPFQVAAMIRSGDSVVVRNGNGQVVPVAIYQNHFVRTQTDRVWGDELLNLPRC